MTPSTSALPGRPPVVDPATWQTARDELLVREKAHTREGDALAAARRAADGRVDGHDRGPGADGPVPFLDLFQGRDELVIYHHMWHDGVPHQGQCAGCTFNVWQMKDTVYLQARGVSFAVLTSGRWDEVAPFVDFMGYTQPWYSVRGVEAAIATDEGHIVCYLRDGDRAFLTYRTTGRGNEPADGNARPPRHDALRPGRGVAGQPRGLARGTPLLLVLGDRPGGERHLGPDQPPRAPVDPPGRDPRGRPRPAGLALTTKAQVNDLGFRVWRCRESNPGPPLLHVGFSVRSLLCLYLDPPVTQTSRCDDPSRCLLSLSAPRPGGQVSPPS